ALQNFFFTGLLFSLAAKFIFNSMVIASLGVKVLVAKLPLGYQVQLLPWQDGVFQLGCLMSLGLFLIWLIKNATAQGRLKQLYIIPTLMLATEVGRLALISQSRAWLNLSDLGHTQTNAYGVIAFLMLGGIIGVYWMIAKRQGPYLRFT
ncbi:MAG: hypothetical protein AAF804_09315, partial [Bacteroidota bacterium]